MLYAWKGIFATNQFLLVFLQKLKLWKLGENALEEIHSETLTLGGLHALRFSPDSGPILAIGGEKEDMIRVIGVDKFEPMIRAFSSS